MINILILQNKILHYRKALYNELSKFYNITILHSGHKSICKTDSGSRTKLFPIILLFLFFVEMRNKSHFLNNYRKGVAR